MSVPITSEPEMTSDLKHLEERLWLLAEELSSLHQDLTAACEQLLEPGIPPAAELVDRCTAARQDFEALQQELRTVTERLGIDLVTDPRDLDSLDALTATVAAGYQQLEANQTIAAAAEATLDWARRLVHRDDPAFDPLQRWKSHAATLRHQLHSPPGEWDTEVKSLVEGLHPLLQLRRLVEPEQELDDEEWEGLVRLCEEAFGKPLALAAARGKLVVGPEEAEETSAPELTAADEPTGAADHEAGEHEQSPTVPDDEAIGNTLADSVPLPTDDAAEGPAHYEVSHPDEREPVPTDLTNDEEEPAVPEPAAVDPVSPTDTVLDTPLRPDTLLPDVEPSPGSFPDDPGSLTTTDTDYAAESTGEHEATVHEAAVLEAPVEQPEAKEGSPEAALPAFSGIDANGAEIAAAARRARPEERSVLLRDLIWRLIETEQHSLAYHLAGAMESCYPEFSPVLPSWLLRAATLGPHVTHASGHLASLLKEDFGNFGDACFPAGKEEWNHALRLLLAAAALRPALLVPSTGAPTVLQGLRMKEGLSYLYDYCQTVAAYAHQFQALNPNALKRVKTLAAWQSDLTALVGQVEAWCVQAPRMTIIYAPATRVWQKWQEPGGLIHALTQPIRQNDMARADAVRLLADRLSNEANVRREIVNTDRKVLGRRGEDITAKALGQLRMHVRTAVGFAERWLELCDTRPDAREDAAHSQAARLRDEVMTRQHLVYSELQSFAGHSGSIAIQASVRCCLRALHDIGRLFDPEAPFAAEEPQVEHLLHADLLRVPTLPLNGYWEPESAPPDVIIDSILALVEAGTTDWRDAFECQSERRDHEATARIIEYLESRCDSPAHVDELRQLRKKHLEECREALHNDLQATSSQVEGAVAFGLLRENDRNRLAAALQGIELLIPDAVKFHGHHDELRAIRDELEIIRQTGVDTARRRLECSHLSKSDPAYSRVLSVLEHGDVLTANEYIDMAVQGQELPSPEVPIDSFTDFFIEKFAAIEEFWKGAEAPGSRSRTWVRDLLDDIAKGRSVGPISLQRVPGAQAREAAEMLRAWFSAKQAQRVEPEHARTILSHLGFNVLSLTVDASRGYHWVHLVAEPLRDRNRCPVPTYGSLAGGRYRILCVWGRPTEEDLINSVGETTHNAPAIVFYFGRMTEKRRRDLARLCRQRRRTFLVLDDTLLLYLCGERGSRLPVLFGCALPFTFLEPYTTTASLVPPEMFYGRERQRDQIIDRMGAWFIYGGRQLGKTALLRDVERTFHSPKEGRIALWLDLKTEGITSTRSIDEIWSLVASELKRKGVLPASLPAHTGLDRLFEHITSWLDGDEQRRILLLLDEADRFLEADATEGLVRLDRIKGLMDRTERRFKVVFAGLHNVLRTTRLPDDVRGVNPSLGHSQEPICIGPLLDNGEWRDARALIERPMAGLGYQLPPDLTTRILSQTNYYPSLIQLYCNQLLRHVSEPHASSFDARTSPPYHITSRHVEEAYQSNELRSAIRHRFNLTLQLDRRYEVIAYAMAYEFLSDGSAGVVEGFPVPWIREQALTWWSEGFRNDEEDAFRYLLDEMVGLGMLRMVEPGRYTLRSPNVVALIGTQDEIETELLKPREAPLEYEPATFRSALGTGANVDHSRRSPLSAQQEAELRGRRNGVSLVFGCPGADLRELPTFLEAAVGQEFFVSVENVIDRAGFARALDDLATRERDGTTLIYVPDECAWSPYWVEDALQRVNRLRSKNAFVRVVFVADPRTTWGLLSDGQGQLERLAASGVTSITLRPWHDAALRQWLEDCGFGPDNRHDRARITEVTGNWPILLRELYQRSRQETHRWERHLEELSESLQMPGKAAEAAASLGLDLPGPQRVLSDLAALGDATADELIGVIDEVPAQLVNQSIRWAELLGLAHSTSGKAWRIDPVAARLLAILA